MNPYCSGNRCDRFDRGLDAKYAHDWLAARRAWRRFGVEIEEEREEADRCPSPAIDSATSFRITALAEWKARVPGAAASEPVEQV